MSQRRPSLAVIPAALLVVLCFEAAAATSPSAAPSPFDGNGHNVTFDGRLFIVRRTPGWEAAVLRPEAVTPASGFVDMSGAFSPRVLIQAEQLNENALAICEPSPQPYRCEQSGVANAAGTYDCYDLVIIDSDALAAKPANVMRRRELKVIISQPRTAAAAIQSFTWTQPSPVTLSTVLRGLEPTVTRDGKLLVWQGVPSNTGDIDTLVYSVNSTACAATGWSAPKSITAMHSDPLVFGKYKLAEKPLRGADGAVFSAGQLFYGAYPWVFPDGEAVNFTATNMPCRTPAPNEDPPGCGPRRNALSVIGYPTNWQLAHVDGAVNPDTDQTVRLFFSSPGRTNVPPLPALAGLDVWPFFGSNTSNYTELVFDDGLDGRYGGLWHFNELVNNVGAFDLSRTPDSSGYSNTGALKGGALFPPKNNGALGKAIVFNGTGARVEVAHASSLNPVNALTLELALNPASDPDCDAKNNYRFLLGKGNINDGAYTLVLEENRDLQARVRVAGGAQYSINLMRQVPVGQWTHVAVQYDAATGTMVARMDGVETNRVVHPPALLAGTTHSLLIGAPGVKAACPDGDGAFHGQLDEVAVTRAWRYGTPPGTSGGMDAGVGGEVDGGVEPPDAGTHGPDAGPGQTPDAGPPAQDAGLPAPDAGTAAQDAGAAEPGNAEPADAGGDRAPGQGTTAYGSCGCTASDPFSAGLLALVGLFRLLRHRRPRFASRRPDMF